MHPELPVPLFPIAGLSESKDLWFRFFAALRMTATGIVPSGRRAHHEVFDEMSKHINQQLVKLGGVINTDIIAFNELVGELDRLVVASDRLPVLIPRALAPCGDYTDLIYL